MGASRKAGHPIRHIQLVLVPVTVEHVHQLVVRMVAIMMMMMVIVFDDDNDDDDDGLMPT